MGIPNLFVLCLCLTSVISYDPELEERVTYLQNKIGQISSRVLSLEYAVKDLMASMPTSSGSVDSNRIQGSAPAQSLPSGGPSAVSIQPEPDMPMGERPQVPDGFRPRDCSQIREELDSQRRHSTFYTVYPLSPYRPMEVFCDMETLGGGWTVIQRRGHDEGLRESFNRTYKEYEKGFGQIDRDFWIGLQTLVALTKYDDQEVMYELLTKTSDGRHSITRLLYDRFKVEDAPELYRLRLVGFNARYSNGLSLNLEKQDGAAFSTRDKDNAGTNNRNCKHNSGWWLLSTICHRQPDLNMPFDEHGVLHIHKYNVVQDWHGVSIKVRARMGIRVH